jgi:hypothetical protein
MLLPDPGCCSILARDIIQYIARKLTLGTLKFKELFLANIKYGQLTIILFPIREITDSNAGPQTLYPKRFFFSLFITVPPGKIMKYHLNIGHDGFHSYISRFIIRNNLVIHCFIT